MNWREFRRTGHWPTLLSAFLYFDVSFMVWVMLGPLAAYIGKALETPAETMFALVRRIFGHKAIQHEYDSERNQHNAEYLL